MRNLRLLDTYRVYLPVYESWGDEGNGAFIVPSPIDKASMQVIASIGEGWEHVSVSRKNRIPNWQEMEHVKRLFFKNEETAMQLHPPVSEYVNFHPHCLHIWRPTTCEIPRPPGYLIGPTGEDDG